MYLKSIEVQGFKSFANKMVLEFHDGITGIVGPNGSGKSNVADAVRWVLGEQSAKQLRGNKMEDVIFSGTEARKPLGFAYVAITLDNSSHDLNIDYDEVKIARRVFRSGESEYQINGNSCRLRDVQELLLDTGIGKEGYSIIGQGQIEKILSGKPEERRELFDEAAGIVKFKKRKLAAQKNLEAERQNLYRVTDILSEIEKQIGPLEKQSKVAKQYLSYREELKKYDVNMFLLEHERITNEKKKLEEKNIIAANDLSSTKDSYDLAKIEYEKLEETIDKINTKTDEVKNRLSELKVLKEQKDGQIKVLNEQIIASNQNHEHLKTRLNSINEEVAGKEKQVSDILEKRKEIELKIKALQKEEQEIKLGLESANKDITAVNDKMEALKGEIFDLLSENANIKSKMQRYEAILEQNNLKKITLNQRLLKNKQEEDACKTKLELHNKKIHELGDKLLHLNQKQKETTEKLNTIAKEIHNIYSTLDGLQQSYHKEQSRLEYLTNITERYEGYGNSIRKLMEHKREFPGIHGVVADIIKVQKKYETAVETALGGSIQNIVTDNEETAKKLIELLKKNRYGRATFLPLTSITNKNQFYNEAALLEPGVIGLASTLVETEETYKKVVESLLGRIVVVDHIDHAIALQRKYQYSLRIVTIEGDLLNPGGSMSGGAYKNSSNLLGRRREIEEIKKSIADLQGKIGEYQNILKEHENQKEHLNAELLQVENSIHETNLSLNTEKLTMNQTKVDIKNVELDLKDIKAENDEIEKQAKELKENLELLQTELEKNTSKSEMNDAEIARLQEEVEEKRRDHNDVTSKLSEIKIALSNQEQTIEFHTENMFRVKEELARLLEEKKTTLLSIEECLKTKEEREHTIETIQKEIEESSVNIEECKEQIESLSAKKEEITTQHKDFFHKREELAARINALDKECYRLTSNIEKFEDQLTTLVNYMFEEYEITYSDALSLRSEENYSLSQLKKMIAEVKANIKSLGDVNVNAIEDYKNTMERYELLKTQHDDIVKAEEVLLGIIEELDTEMRKQFEEKFALIQAQFDKVFKEMFGGGKGTLELVEDEDLLEAGIRINAQPPGKKLQNMMQLSGGEKALTAISLLFAIQNLKPSPFCLLDEIEAALDESNVERYARYLKKLTDKTQFIIITHRRGSMAMADRLYGITMQEKGVSTLVSVNLIENQLEK